MSQGHVLLPDLINERKILMKLEEVVQAEHINFNRPKFHTIRVRQTVSNLLERPCWFN